MRLPSSGYEAYDACLRRLAWSPVAALTSAGGRSSFVTARLAQIPWRTGSASEVDLLAVHHRLGMRNGSEPVVHGMRRSQPSGFETEARQQRVRLDGLYQGSRHHVVPDGFSGRGAVGEEGVPGFFPPR